MTGTMAILNVGAGDTKLTFDRKKPQEVKRARAVVLDMIKRGFAIMIEVGTKDGAPLYQRAVKFDPKTDEYIIMGVPEDAENEDAEKQKAPAPRRRGKKAERRIKADSTSAIAVARSAGG